MTLPPLTREPANAGLPAVRTAKWRFVDNGQLYNIERDPSETQNVAANHPDVVDRLRKAYSQWWDSTIPLLVNEDLPRVRPEQQPFALRYAKQLKQRGIPDWAPDDI